SCCNAGFCRFGCTPCCY
uniref:Conotoxin tx3e n=3 Tax=Conus TaxID=6490 RepID=M3E_CONTE|nr:RecName: Full=Conotoxin tx3e; AltName: Full=Conotoxin 4; Contains: RecName: Full=Truncated conotoxin tx3e [Conus textile]